MYYLYIDESGDDSLVLPLHTMFYDNTVRYFVVGGIIVDEDGKKQFEQTLNNIMTDYFPGITLPPNFKLHYEGLRNKCYPKFPYNTLSETAKYEITNKMFEAICSINCKLLSVSINVKRHADHYKDKAANPRAYALLLLMERFQYFLEEVGEKGVGIYERYNKHLRRKVESVQHGLLSRDRFPKPTDFTNVSRSIKSGEPSIDRVLQFTDFFVYTHYIKNMSHGAKADRWYSINHKYYNLDHKLQFKRGNYDVEYDNEDP